MVIVGTKYFKMISHLKSHKSMSLNKNEIKSNKISNQVIIKFK